MTLLILRPTPYGASLGYTRSQTGTGAQQIQLPITFCVENSNFGSPVKTPFLLIGGITRTNDITKLSNLLRRALMNQLKSADLE